MQKLCAKRKQAAGYHGQGGSYVKISQYQVYNGRNGRFRFFNAVMPLIIYPDAYRWYKCGNDAIYFSQRMIKKNLGRVKMQKASVNESAKYIIADEREIYEYQE
jgi:hypothetical protein